MTKSKDPIGRCFNWEFTLNSFARQSVCMNNVASRVPNHEYGCGANCYCFCICELSVVVFAVLKKNWHFVVILGLSFVMISPCRSHCTITTPRSEWVVIKHVSLNFSCRGLRWLWSGCHTSRLLRLICAVLVVRVVDAKDVLEIICWILWSYGLMPRRLKGSHPMMFTNHSVSVIAPLSLVSTLALFLTLIS